MTAIFLQSFFKALMEAFSVILMKCFLEFTDLTQG